MTAGTGEIHPRRVVEVSQYSWNGQITFEELPMITHPEQGYVVTSNQAMIGKEYPYLLTDDWSYWAQSAHARQATPGLRTPRRSVTIP